MAAAVRAVGLPSPRAWGLGAGAGSPRGLGDGGAPVRGACPPGRCPRAPVRQRGSSLAALAGPWQAPLVARKGAAAPLEVPGGWCCRNRLGEPMPTGPKKTSGPNTPERTCGEGWRGRPPPPRPLHDPTSSRGWRGGGLRSLVTVGSYLPAATARPGPSLPSPGDAQRCHLASCVRGVGAGAEDGQGFNLPRPHPSPSERRA